MLLMRAARLLSRACRLRQDVRTRVVAAAIKKERESRTRRRIHNNNKFTVGHSHGVTGSVNTRIPPGRR